MGVHLYNYPDTAAKIGCDVAEVEVSEALAPCASLWDTRLDRIGHTVVHVSMLDPLLMKVNMPNDRAGSWKVPASLLVAAHACLAPFSDDEQRGCAGVCNFPRWWKDAPDKNGGPGRQLFVEYREVERLPAAKE